VKLSFAGLPGAGKTTVFNVLTGRMEEVGGFSNKPAVASLPIPDARLDRIWEEYKPPKKVCPALTIHDMPQGMKESEAFALLREMDLLLIVLRMFESEFVPYNRPALDPAADLVEFRTRLALSDIQLIEKRLEKLEKQLKRPGPEHDSNLKEQKVLQRMLPLMEEGSSLQNFDMTTEEEKLVRHYGLLTLKPAIIILNAGDEQCSPPASLKDALVVHGKLEMEICQLGGEEQRTFLREYGICRSGPGLLSACYRTLDIVTFYTTGDEEVRGWMVPSGTPAPEAAGKIHSDMQKGFIKAEVVPYEKLVEIGSLKEARASAGRLEGKDYHIQDGDIVTIRFNP
jgi:ribosome-binding ATPase YchF (GTP1/OBG family)